MSDLAGCRIVLEAITPHQGLGQDIVMRVFVYLCSPVGSWPGWLAEEDFHSQLHSSDRMRGEECWAGYERLREKGFKMSERLGWEGDIIDGPFVAGLPSAVPTGVAHVMVAWRRGFDGATFMASPLELSWLREASHSAWVCDSGD